MSFTRGRARFGHRRATSMALPEGVRRALARLAAGAEDAAGYLADAAAGKVPADAERTRAAMGVCSLTLHHRQLAVYEAADPDPATMTRPERVAALKAALAEEEAELATAN